MNDMPIFGPGPVNTKTALEDIAIETGTPIEVLFAAGERAGAKSPDEFLSAARQQAQQLGPRFKAGEDPRAIIGEVFGPEAQRSFGDYATNVRAHLYGSPTVQEAEPQRPEEANAFRDVPAAIGASVVRSGGSIVRGVGEGISVAADVAKGVAEPVVEGAMGREVEYFDRKSPNVLSGVADAIGGEDGAAGFLDSFISQEVKQDVQDFIDPDADLFSPSTWKMGPRPTVRGAIYSAVDVFGSMAPVVAASLLTGNVGAAVVGGAMGAGFGAEESGKVIDELASTRGPDGRTRLEAESSVYQRQIANGATPEEALEFTKRRASQLSAVFASVPAALGGVATSAIVRGAGRVAGRLPWYIGVPAAGAVSGLEEGTQEVAEGVAARTATNIGAGLNENVTEGTLSEFVVGAMGGSPIGAGAAGIERYRNRNAQPGQLPPGEAPPAAGTPPSVPPVVGPRGDEPRDPSPTSDVLQPTTGVDTAGQPAPSPLTDALGAAPAPVLSGLQQGQQVAVQIVDPETGEISDPTPMTFVGEDVAGGYASFRAPDGSAAEVEVSDIASGNVIVARMDAPVSMAPATAAPAGEAIPPQDAAGLAQQPVAAPTAPAPTQQMQLPPIPAGVDPDAFMERVAIRQADGMTPDQAYQITLQDALEAMREDVGDIADDVQERQRRERENQSKITEAAYTDDRGQPVIFPTERALRNRLGAGYTPEPFGEGFIGVRQQEAAGNDGNDSLGGDGSAVPAGGDNPAGSGADGAFLGEGRQDTQGAPAAPSVAEGVADATGDADEQPALTGAQGQTSSWIIREKDGGAVVMETFDKKVVDALNTAKYEAVPAREYLAGLNAPADQNPINSEAAPDQDVTPGQAETAPADQEADPIRAAVRDAIAAGPVQHTTAKGKVLDGYILKGVKAAQIKDAFDTGTFPKDGGTFIRKDRADTFMGQDAPAAPAAEATPAPDAPAATPTRQEVEQAAAQADPAPTEGQKEAGNYRKGSVRWNGLDLSIENAKGSERTGTAPDGSTWSVTMPAHYGYFKGTESSDGDHVDFYMGDVPNSDYVLIINQVDPETQKLDEHKVIIGTTARGAALGIYRDGFSDGSGNSRIGSFTETNVASLKNWLAPGVIKKPSEPINMPFAKRNAEVKNPTKKPDAPKRQSPKKARAEFLAKLREYFTPGNIVQGYGGADRVISFNAEDGDNWTVTVEGVSKQGDTWVAEERGPRTHSTNPDKRELAKGPIEKVRAAETESATAEAALAPETEASTQPTPAPAQQASDGLEARQERVNATRANAETRDWWNNGIAPPTRPVVLKDMGLFPGKEEYVGGRKWDDLSEDQREQIVSATSEMRAKRKAEADAREAEAAKRTDAERERKAAAKAAQDEADKIASVSPLSSLRGGTAAAVLKIGSKSRFVDSAGYVGHGVFFMRRGVDPAFDALVDKENPVVDSLSEGITRIMQGAEKAREPIEWRFVRNSFNARSKDWKPSDVIGFWDNSSSIGKSKKWVAVNPIVASYISRKGLVLTAGQDEGMFAVRRQDGEIVGATAAISTKGMDDLEDLDAIAQGEVTPPPVEVTAPSDATPDAQPAAPAQAATPDRNSQIEAALSKIATVGRGKKIADDFRAMLASEKDDLADTKKTQKASKDGSIYDEDVARVEARIAGIEGRILYEAESIKQPKGEAKPAPKPAPKSTDKIEDFGEKIGGARKDVWGGFKDRMDAAEAMDIKAEPLSKSWPEPDYEKLIEAGVDAWTVGFVRAARESIPRKPTASWKLKTWVASVETLRKFASDLMNDKVSVADVQVKVADSNVLTKNVGNKIDLYLAVGHSKSLKDFKFGQSYYSVKAGISHNPPLALWEVSRDRKASVLSNMPLVLVSEPSKEAAIAGFKKIHALLDDSGAKKGSRDKGAKFQIYGRKSGDGKVYTVETKIGKNSIVLRDGITEVDEARRILREEREQLQAQLDRMRDIPNERRDENAPRMGEDRRNGADITPEVFAETFGFRGIEFGNWVEQGRRQQDLNDAYDALMDMAAILDIPPKAVSLNGGLGLAFGARGKGGKNPAAAHFEPGKMVINMTKRAGRGSLAHEWFHALDNYFALKRKQSRGQYITDNNSPAGPLTEGVRPETIEAFLAVKRAIANTKLKARSQEMDKTRTTPYWGTGIEMHARAFESYMLAKLADQDASNDYLVNVVDPAMWDAMAAMQGLGDSYPYLKPDEIEGVRAAFDNLFRILERRETDRGVAMEMRGDANPPVATLTGKELGDWSDMRQLERKAEAWYRDNLLDQTVENEATGMAIRFNARGAKKSTGRKGEDLYRLVPALREILASGRLIGTESDRQERREVKAVHKIQADVSLAGNTVSVIATVREMRDGTFHYDLSKDRNGAEVLQGVSPANPTVELRSPTSALEGDPVDLNLEFASAEVNTDPAFTEDASRAVTRRLVAEVAKVLPGTKVGVRLVRQLHSIKDGAPIMGRANPDGSIEVSASAARDEAGAVGILNHELVHVLRNADLWRSDYGLFKRGEWERLVRQAESNKELVKAVRDNYKDKNLTPEQMQEEYVAEMYRGWKAQTGDYGAVERILAKIEEFFRALASAFRGEGFDSAGRTMQRIADGGIGGRGPGGPGRGVRRGAMGAVPAEMRAGSNPDPVAYPSVMSSISKLWSRKPATSAAALDAKEGKFVSNLLTNAMAMNDSANTLSLVPGEVLFRDLGKNLPSAGRWVKTMRQQTAERQEMHAEADVLAQEWQQAYRKDKVNGRKLHDLMHESTIEQIDPSERFRAPRRPQDMTDAQYMNYVEDRRAKHAELRDKFRDLPENMQDIYRKARDAYKEFDAKLIDAMVDAVVKAMGLQAERLKARYDGELQQFKDDGLEGDALKEAQRKARSRYNQDVKMLEFSRNARIRKMRLTYEANRIEGPYFPLMRFGQFFVAARNEKGKLVHFERTSTAGSQARIAKEMRAQGLAVQAGVMKPEENLSRFVDPNFVADITESLGEAGADSQVLDAIYQRYLETLPSFSIRKANIHRQGIPGFDKDAIKAFGSRMFHGAHQLTRLRHSMDLTKHVESARREAARAADPVRATAIVNEMQKRHEWSLNPQGASWSAWATSAAFVWYLGLTPAAAVVNLTQTTVVGIPILTAGIEGNTIAKSAAALSKALGDFTAGLKKGDAEWSRGALTSGRLTSDERAALQAAYISGALDKSQSHDIAAIGDSGVTYSATREKIMRPISFLFHHAERLNREVTFLAAYRLSKDAGMSHEAAIEKAGDLTWDTHFNYENWSRPRFMQNDYARVAFVFRQFQVNMLYRLFRDTHQALKGESPEVRKQARQQLMGITGMMMLHAGVTGTWGYALIMLLAGMFMEGGAEEAEEELKGAMVGLFGPQLGGAILKGPLGQATGTDLTSRIGMPELWFRSPDRQLEGRDAYNYFVEQLLGAVPPIALNMFRGMEMVGDGEVWKGTELMVPKAIRDQLRAVRYANEGVTTSRGDPLIDDVSAHTALVQALGFSPARVSEQYERNRRMMNMQRRIEDERRAIMADITRYMMNGEEVSKRAARRRDEFNAKYPLYAIDFDTLKRSMRARQNMSQQMEGGIRVNQKLAPYLRENMAPTISN